MELNSIRQISGPDPSGAGPLCLILVHNEFNILPQFFDHYRRFGAVQFLAIDDRSTDGSRAYLAAQPDVALFEPQDGTAYKSHKRQWRGEPLDAYGTGRWCIVPDVDEHLIWRGFEDRSFSDLVADLDREGAQGIAGTMVDMYADKPIAEHFSTDVPHWSTSFPYFDDPLKRPPRLSERFCPGTGSAAGFPTPA